MNTHEAIAALATPEGPGVLAVVRLSGAGCWEALQPLVATVGEPADEPFVPRRPQRCELRWCEEAATVPALVIPFADGASYTGEESVEVLLPAAPPLVRSFLETLRERGVRPAEPGEFTRRAFLSGRMDLTSAESVAQLIAAEDLHTTQVIRHSLDGDFAAEIERIATAVHRQVALLEAGLDFSEQEVDPPDAAELTREIDRIEECIQGLLRGPAGRVRETPRVRVLLWGAANAGKSTLFNRLVGHELAITSPQPGTTRDPISATVRWDGIPEFELLDLAGQKASQDAIEQEADRLGAGLLAAGDTVLYLLDGTRPATQIEAEWRGLPQAVRSRAWPLVSKVDLEATPEGGTLQDADCDPLAAILPGAIRCSGHTGEGVAELRNRLARQLASGCWNSRGDGYLFTHRQRGRLTECLGWLAEARPQDEVQPELTVVDLRNALVTLREVTGEITTEDTLDLIFGEFCLGK